MNYKRWQEMMTLKDHLVEALNKASQADPREYDLEVKIVYEVAAAWARRHEGCVVPNFDDVIRADTYQAGHSDWGTKFPLYVAELTYGLNPWSSEEWK